jgi:UDPglucose 6-dehydrogenase
VNIGVLGLWHLGSVTAAGLAALGHEVVGLDFDERRVADLRRGAAPVFEPGLDELIKQGLSSGKLRFSSAVSEATRDIDVLWVAYDTPVDDDDLADADFVMTHIRRALAEMSADIIVLVSSQLPVGSVALLEEAGAAEHGSPRRRIAYCPENLRLGNAVSDFLHPERIVVGVRSNGDKELLGRLLGSITNSIEWMSVESAEMTKHAINAFFATSVAFANEIASICEVVGADAKEVERGLKTENRIGPRAYLSPGAAFAGGTLARDVAYLNRTSREHGVTTLLLSSVLASNDAHKLWAQKKLQLLFGDLSHITVAVWGLTYKPDTDTLRRSMSVELCDWLVREGVKVQVHDPMAKDLPERWRESVKRFETPLAAAQGAHALVMATQWPIYRTVEADQLAECCEGIAVLDASRFLPNLAASTSASTSASASDGRFRYFSVGA